MPSEHTTRAPGGSTTVPSLGAEPPPPKLELHAANPIANVATAAATVTERSDM